MWRLHSDIDEAKRERAERIALRIVGVCFMVLAVYVIYDAGRSLWYREPPERSLFGIAVASAALIVMPLLTRAKRKVGRSINSRVGGRQTDRVVRLLRGDHTWRIVSQRPPGVVVG